MEETFILMNFIFGEGFTRPNPPKGRKQWSGWCWWLRRYLLTRVDLVLCYSFSFFNIEILKIEDSFYSYFSIIIFFSKNPPFFFLICDFKFSKKNSTELFFPKFKILKVSNPCSCVGVGGGAVSSSVGGTIGGGGGKAEQKGDEEFLGQHFSFIQLVSA